MRKLFSRQLVEARHEMLSIYEAVDLALHDAVKAYVTDDRKLATKTKKRTLSIDARCANLEAVCYNLIATQSPVASDFRLLQTIIYVDFNLQRMTDKVRQICRATRHMIKADISLPKELVGTVEAEAEAVYQVLGSSLSALVTNDMSIICNLAVEDEPVHAAYEKFFRTFNRMDTGDFMDDDSNYDDLRRAIMVSRYLDRIASISIDAACRLTFLLTGQRMTAGDIACTDEDELESMRVPSGEGVIMRPAVDARYVAKVPVNEVSEGLRYLLDHLEDEDDGEDGRMAVLPKKEQAVLGKELTKLQTNLGGARDMKGLPQALFVIDTKREENAIKEAQRLNIPVVALIDTNSDPDEVEYGIPCNDDAISAVTLMCELMADACLAGSGKEQVSEAEMAAEPKAE